MQCIIGGMSAHEHDPPLPEQYLPGIEDNEWHAEPALQGMLYYARPWLTGLYDHGQIVSGTMPDDAPYFPGQDIIIEQIDRLSAGQGWQLRVDDVVELHIGEHHIRNRVPVFWVAQADKEMGRFRPANAGEQDRLRELVILMTDGLWQTKLEQEVTNETVQSETVATAGLARRLGRWLRKR